MRLMDWLLFNAQGWRRTIADFDWRPGATSHRDGEVRTQLVQEAVRRLLVDHERFVYRLLRRGTTFSPTNPTAPYNDGFS